MACLGPRKITRNACIKCRFSKLKCDASRPTCGRCRRSRQTCQYDVASESISKTTSLRLKNQTLVETLEQSQSVLEKLRSEPDEQAAEVLACWRLGDSLKDILRDTSSRAPVIQKPVFSSPSSLNLNIFGCLPTSSAIRSNHYPAQVQGEQMANYRMPIHLLSTLWLPPDEAVGMPLFLANEAFITFRAAARSKIQQSAVPGSTMMGPPAPTDMHRLSNVGQDTLSEPQDVSEWTTQYIGSFTGMKLSDRLACWLLVYTLVCWQVFPCGETYGAIPEWFRPTGSQCFVPHMACVDAVPWPFLRDHLIQHPEDFIHIFSHHISVSWPYSDREIIFFDQSRGLVAFTSAFIDWCFRMENWTLPTSVSNEYPHFIGKVTFR